MKLVNISNNIFFDKETSRCFPWSYDKNNKHCELIITIHNTYIFHTYDVDFHCLPDLNHLNHEYTIITKEEANNWLEEHGYAKYINITIV